MTTKSVFISRYVFSNSPLRHDASFSVHARSLIKFESVPITEFPIADWYFFYSRNGVFYSLRQLVDRSLISNIKIGTMGKGTAQQYEAMTGEEPEFIGSGDAEHVATEFLQQANQASVVFVRASKSLQSVQNTLRGKVKDIDLIVYHNKIDREAKIPETDIAAFTSPMNVDAYFQMKQFETPEILIALGKSTKLAIQKYSDAQIYMPEAPSEAAVKVLIDSLL